jgi:hypothetical protein
MTLQSIYIKIKEALNSSGIEDSGFEAKLILKRYLNISDSEFLTLYNREIEKEKELLI